MTENVNAAVAPVFLINEKRVPDLARDCQRLVVQEGVEGMRTMEAHFIAVGADLFADIAVTSQMEAILTVGGYRFDYGTGNAKTGYGMEGRLGYRWGPVQPEGNFNWFNSDTKKNSYLKVAGGLNVFLSGVLTEVTGPSGLIELTRKLRRALPAPQWL